MEGIFPAWGRILQGYRPNLSIEITRECPLRCPGCYAYGDEHLGGGQTLRGLADFKGQALIDGVLDVVAKHRPIHLSIVGGEPLVRFRELDVLLPRLAEMGIYSQLVTSAVRPIPEHWAGIKHLQICVSIDGLQPEHDVRRTPATYDRILKHIKGHQITVHCTVTRQQVQREGYIETFLRQWSENTNVRTMWISLYTPQIGEQSEEMLTSDDRARVVTELMQLRERFPKLQMPKGLLNAYLHPPEGPEDCIFAKTTECVSADLQTKITPCQFGGNPDCGSCGCIASAGLKAVGRHILPGGIRVGSIFDASFKVGNVMRGLRERGGGSSPGVKPTAVGDASA
jgi:sulfatase maturation enzyme AslB (radical SAM superfamily)